MNVKFSDKLRFHPIVQAAYGQIGEDEMSMVSFTTALQEYVSSKFGVEPSLGIQLIRSAVSLFPESAKNLSHYVHHNRATRGTLQVGDVAPDVNVSTLDGRKSTLWTEVERYDRLKRDKQYTTDEEDDNGYVGDHPHGGHDDDHNGHNNYKPTIIIGASYT